MGEEMVITECRSCVLGRLRMVSSDFDEILEEKSGKNEISGFLIEIVLKQQNLTKNGKFRHFGVRKPI